VDELDNDGKVDVVRVYFARGAAGEKRQNRSKAFAATPNRIHNIALQRWIKCRRLLCNSDLYLFKMRLNQPRHFSQRTGRRSESRKTSSPRA
jgi:hypothetical protein